MPHPWVSTILPPISLRGNIGMLSTGAFDSVALLSHVPWASSTTIEVTLLLLSAASVYVSLSPPNPPVNDSECRLEKAGTNALFEEFVHSVTSCSKIMMWMGSFYSLKEIICQPSLPSGKLLVEFSLSSRKEETLPFVKIGAACVIFGAALRLWWCFKSLGPLFTFEITIRPQHELITTGPYAWVRHPSYTGVYLTLSGATLVLLGPRRWVGASGMVEILFAFLWVAKCVFAFRGMHVRHQIEDEILRQAFGQEWEEYAARVPYKFVPGLL